MLSWWMMTLLHSASVLARNEVVAPSQSNTNRELQAASGGSNVKFGSPNSFMARSSPGGIAARKSCSAGQRGGDHNAHKCSRCLLLPLPVQRLQLPGCALTHERCTMKIGVAGSAFGGAAMTRSTTAKLRATATTMRAPGWQRQLAGRVGRRLLPPYLNNEAPSTITSGGKERCPVVQLTLRFWCPAPWK